MSIASNLQTLATNLSTILNQINAKLTIKGAASASNLNEVASRIDSISTGVTPTGTKTITENGTVDVTNYAVAEVDVPTALDTSDATAVASDMANGKTAYVKGVKVTGNVAEKDASNLSVSANTVSVPAGIYRTQASKSVPTAQQAVPSVSVNSSTGLVTATATQGAGYVAAGSQSGTLQLTAKTAQTYTPGTSDQTIPAGRYTTGAQTIKGDANLIAGNIKSGVSIFGVAGTHHGDAALDESSFGSVFITGHSVSQFELAIPSTIDGTVIGVVLRHDGEYSSIRPSGCIADYIALPTGDGTMGVIVTTEGGESTVVIKDDSIAYKSGNTFVLNVPGTTYLPDGGFDTYDKYTFSYIVA